MPRDAIIFLPRQVMVTLTDEEWAWIDMSAAASHMSRQRYVTSVLREIVRDDMAEERKAAS